MAPGDSAPEAADTPTLTVEALVAALQEMRGRLRHHLVTGIASSPRILEEKEM